MAQLSQKREAILKASLQEAQRVTFNDRALPILDGKELQVISGKRYALNVREWATYFGEEVPQAFLPILAEADRERERLQTLSTGGGLGISDRDGFTESAALREE